MIVGPDKNLWLAEINAIARMTVTGRFKTYNLSPLETWGLGVGSDGEMWFVCADATLYLGVCKITTSGRITVLSNTYYFTGPFVLGSDGNLWSPAYNEVSKIGKITPSGAATYYNEPANGRVENIAPGGSGRLWFTDSRDNKVGSITTAGKVHEFSVRLVNSDPGSLAYASDGDIWLAPTAYEDLVRVSGAGKQSIYKVQLQSGFIVRGNGSLLYAISGVGDIIQMNVQTGAYTITYSPGDFKWSVTSATLGPDRNIWMTGSGSPTSIVQRVQIPGGD
jgi:virginiamycin B lyase